MVFPKLNRIFKPPLGIRTDTKSKTMTGIFIFVIGDVYPGVSQIRDPSIHNGYADDAVVPAYGYKSRRIVFRKASVAGIGNDNHTRLGQIPAAKAGDAV